MQRIHGKIWLYSELVLLMVVLPSALDGMPQVILEAGALGKPVVASAVGSLPEMVRDGETGYLCPPGDVAAFCAAIEKLAGSAALRRSMGEQAREYIQSRFSIEAMIASYAAALGVRTEAAEAAPAIGAFVKSGC